MSSSRALRLALQVMILGLGAYYVLQGQLTAGAMIAASIILGRALAPIERSIGAWRSFVAARAAYANLKRVFVGDAAPSDTVRLPRPAGRLTVEEVYCLAPQSREAILENVSFQLAPGETCAIVGPSGSGKSSLCRLLVGAWKPARGHVRLDGADVSAWDPEDLGPYLGYLPQQVELFPATVAQNIARMHEVDSAEVIAAAKLAGVDGTQAEALLRELTERLAHYLAMEARLRAEQSGHDEVRYPTELSMSSQESAVRAIAGQQDLFESRRATMRGREQILAQRIKQLEEGIKGLGDKIAAEETQISLIDREIAGVKKLYEKGLERLPRLLALQRAKRKSTAHKRPTGPKSRAASRKSAKPSCSC